VIDAGAALAGVRAACGLVQAALPIPVDETGRTGDLVASVIEIAILTWLFYGALKFLHGKAGLAVLKGVLITIVGIVLVLVALTWLVGLQFPRLQVAGTYLLPFFIVVLVVLFQPELRRGFLRMGEVGSLGARGLPGQISDLSIAFRALSRRQTGALVIFERQTGIKGLQDTGVPLDAALSGALLESIFYPKSPLHDGAVIVRGERIVAACCMLPLTDRTSLSRDLGTRHRAALGATEDSDAVAVVVSEETGRISLAHKGKLQAVADPDHLEQVLAEHLNGSMPEDDR
jgi:diadenylate cyclase